MKTSIRRAITPFCDSIKITSYQKPVERGWQSTSTWSRILTQNLINPGRRSVPRNSNHVSQDTGNPCIESYWSDWPSDFAPGCMHGIGCAADGCNSDLFTNQIRGPGFRQAQFQLLTLRANSATTNPYLLALFIIWTTGRTELESLCKTSRLPRAPALPI